MNKVQPLASDCQKDSSSCEIERAVLIAYCVLLWHMDPVSEGPGSGDGGTTAVQHQQNASREKHKHTHTETRTLLLMEDTLSIPLKHADAAWTAGRWSRQQHNCRKNNHLFNLVLADLRADRRNVSKQNPPPLLRAVTSSLPRCYDNLILVYRACTIVYFLAKTSGKIKCEGGVFLAEFLIKKLREKQLQLVVSGWRFQS